MTTLSWNLAGLAEGQLQDWTEQVTGICPKWDFLLLQETFARLEGISTGNHVLLTPSCRNGGLKIPAIMINKRWAPQVKLAGGGARWVACTFGHNVVLITAHLPHSGRGLLEFELMLEELGTFIAGHARKRIIMGIDANAKLLGTTDYHHVGDQTHMTNMNAMDRERARALHTFIADGDLVATNTFKYTDRNEALATRTNWSGNGTSQIDFILVSDSVDVSDIYIGDHAWYNSDHKPLVCTWNLPVAAQFHIPEKIMCTRNWKPAEGWHSAAQYLQNWGAWDTFVADFRHATKKHGQRKAKAVEDPALADLIAKRRESIDNAPARNELNTLIWKRRRVLRRWAETAKIVDCATTGAAPKKPQSRHVNWPAIIGEAVPEEALTTYFTSIFDLPPEQRICAEKARYDRIVVARDLHIDSGRPFVTRKSLDSALTRLKRGKGSADGITAEMLQALPDNARNALAENLAERCARLDFPPDWCISRISLAPKAIGASSLSGFRPIAGLVTMRKLLGYLWLSSLPKIVFFSIQTAFIPGSHADTGPFLLNRSAELAREWRFPLAVGQIDVHKAFDHVRHEACFEALRRKSVSPFSVALIAAIWSATKLVVSPGRCSSNTIAMNRGLPQGAPESAMIFTLLIDMIITDPAEKWAQNGWGFAVDRFKVTAVAYADDIVLFANTPEHLQLMIMDIVGGLEAVGLGVGVAKTHWTSTPPLEDSHIELQGVRIPWEPTITFVGTVVDLSGTSAPAIAYRMAQADKCFAKWRSILTNPNVALRRRLAILPSTVWNALLWSASTWTTTKAQRAQLGSWSARVVARVVKVKRKVDMDGPTHWRLIHRVGHAVAARNNISIVPKVRLRALSWAGHLARLSPKAPAAAALRCRSMQWWRWKQQQVASATQVPGARGAHPRRYKILRWEDQISSVHGEGFSADSDANTGWLEKAQNRIKWRADTVKSAAAPS